MGDFTNWELRPMKKNRDFFTYHIYLIKGFKYYYSLQSDDQIFIDYDNLYGENPRNLQVQNYIELPLSSEPVKIFDCQTEMNILNIANKNLSLLKVAYNDMNENLFLFKFKRLFTYLKQANISISSKRNKFINSLYTYYDNQLKKVNSFEKSYTKNLALYFKDRVLVNYLCKTKEIKYKFL